MDTQGTYLCLAHHTSYLLLWCLPLSATVSRYMYSSKCLVLFNTITECLKAWNHAFGFLAHITLCWNQLKVFPVPWCQIRFKIRLVTGETGDLGWLLTLQLDGHWQWLKKQATRTERSRWSNLLLPSSSLLYLPQMVLHLHFPTVIPLIYGLLLMWKLDIEKAFQLFLLF